MFITFEGIDGSGKTTAIRKVAEYFSGQQPLVVREPGGSEKAEKIRELILSEPYSPVAELLMFQAARAELVASKIRPALEEGRMVLCDRYIDSTIVYQGIGRGHNLYMIDQLNIIATDSLVPDITFLIHISAELSDERTGHRGEDNNHFESEGHEFKKRLSEGYMELSKRHPRFHVIDGSRTPEEIVSEIIEIIKKRQD